MDAVSLDPWRRPSRGIRAPTGAVCSCNSTSDLRLSRTILLRGARTTGPCFVALTGFPLEQTRPALTIRVAGMHVTQMRARRRPVAEGFSAGGAARRRLRLSLGKVDGNVPPEYLALNAFLDSDIDLDRRVAMIRNNRVKRDAKTIDKGRCPGLRS